ncbi:glycosyltransferase family 4 protein [Halocola ammonii]
MKIYFLTQYFPPETGAPQNRLYELALQLQQKGDEVIVLTAMPNYPDMRIKKGYRWRLWKTEIINGIKIHRSAIFVTRARFVLARLLNYFSFVFTSFWLGLFKIKKGDFLFCESPPLFLGITARALSKWKKIDMIFNVSDLWPESAEKLGIVTNKRFLKMATRLEEHLYKKATMISGQTMGIVNNIRSRFPDKKVIWLPNGVNTEQIISMKTDKQQWRKKMGFEESDFLFFYGGILGYAQGLEVILKTADKLRHEEHIKFILLGDGPEKESLMLIADHLELDNVYFYDSVSRDNIPEIISAIDVSVIPLRKIELFKGAIPSKIFESLALEKPILLGVEGEAYDRFIKEGNCGLAFEPENAQSLTDAARQLMEDPELTRKLGKNGLDYVREYFERSKIASKFRSELMEFKSGKDDPEST